MTSLHNGRRPGFEQHPPLPTELLDHGACTDPAVADPDWFLPEADTTDARRARQVCDSCPVWERCDEWATTNGEWGTWAGRRRGHNSLGDPDVRQTAHALFAEGVDHREVARLLDISVPSAIGFHQAWRRQQQRRPA